MKLITENNNIISFDEKEIIKHSLGTIYITDKVSYCVFNKNIEQKFINNIDNLYTLQYPNKEAKQICETYTFLLKNYYYLQTGEYVLEFNKIETDIPLRNFLEYFEYNLDFKHIAWILNRLYSISCLLYYNDIAHNGFILDNFLINPEYHAIMLLGGWEYSKPIGKKLDGININIWNQMPDYIKIQKTSTPTIDLYMIKQLARKMCGYESVEDFKLNKDKLIKENNATEEMIIFLTQPPTGTPIEEFEHWENIIKNAYGERKFIPLSIDYKKIY